MLDSVLSCSAIGAPDTVAAQMKAFIAHTRADELMITSQIFDHAARLRSYEITAFCIGVGSVAAQIVVPLPQRQPEAGMHYFALLGSMWHLLKTTPILRRRATYQACMFGAFSLFWTCVSLELTGPHFNMSQSGVAIFALVGVAGAIASPIAGHRADQGKSRSTTFVALILGVLAFSMPLLIHSTQLVNLGVLVATSIILDMGVSANLVTGQRAIFALPPEIRSRLNGLYMALFFMGGALGSSLGGWMFATHGWTGVLWTGLAFPLTALCVFATEPRK
jgi:predicted MFS family arabinose efflux permease